MSIVVRALRADDLDAADRIFRVAFGTFLGLPDPARFAGDADYVRGRWRTDPDGAFVAEKDGTVVGSVFAVCWGSVGFFGPLTVRPDLWNGGVAQRLLEPVMARFADRSITHAGLFTFAQSAKHVRLYGKFGFHPRFLTVVAGKSVAPPATVPSWSRWSAADGPMRARLRGVCRTIAASLYPGLDLTAEIDATVAHGLGDVVVLADRGEPAGFAVCHIGAGTEAGSGACYVKFGAVGCGPEAERRFGLLLDACEDFAATAGAGTLVLGVNFARDRAQALIAARGFRVALQGVAMHRPNEAGYSRPEVFALDDWR